MSEYKHFQGQSGRSNSLVANTVSQIVPLVAGYGLQLVATPLIVSKLGLLQFGIWSITGAVAQYGALLDFGVSRAITRFIAVHHANDDRRAERAARAIAIGSLTILYSAMAILTIPAAIVLDHVIKGSPGVGSLNIILLGSVTMLGATLLARAFAAFSFGRHRMVSANLALAVANVFTVAAGVIGLFIKPDLTTFATASAIGAIFGLIVTIMTVWRSERELRISKPTSSEISEVLRFGVKGQATSVSDLFVLQLPKLALGLILGPTAAGVYEIGSRLAMGGRALGVAMFMSLTPDYSRSFAVEGIDGVRARWSRTSLVFTTAAMMPILMIGTTASPLVNLWLGQPNEQVVVVVVGLAGAFAINLATGTQTIAANAVNRPGLVARSSLLGAVISATLIVPAIHILGILGALITVGTAFGLAAVYETWMVIRLFAVAPVEFFLRSWAPAILAAAISYPVAWALGELTLRSRLTNGVMALIAAPLVCLAFASIVIALSDDVRKQIKTLLAPMRAIGHRKTGAWGYGKD